MEHKHHEEAAKHNEHAASHHRKAQQHIEEGNHEKAGEHAHAAHGHQAKANEHATEAAKKHSEKMKGSMKNDEDVEETSPGFKGLKVKPEMSHSGKK